MPTPPAITDTRRFFLTTGEPNFLAWANHLEDAVLQEVEARGIRPDQAAEIIGGLVLDQFRAVHPGEPLPFEVRGIPPLHVLDAEGGRIAESGAVQSVVSRIESHRSNFTGQNALTVDDLEQFVRSYDPAYRTAHWKEGDGSTGAHQVEEAISLGTVRAFSSDGVNLYAQTLPAQGLTEALTERRRSQPSIGWLDDLGADPPGKYIDHIAALGTQPPGVPQITPLSESFAHLTTTLDGRGNKVPLHYRALRREEMEPNTEPVAAVTEPDKGREASAELEALPAQEEPAEDEDQSVEVSSTDGEVADSVRALPAPAQAQLPYRGSASEAPAPTDAQVRALVRKETGRLERMLEAQGKQLANMQAAATKSTNEMRLEQYTRSLNGLVESRQLAPGHVAGELEDLMELDPSKATARLKRMGERSYAVAAHLSEATVIETVGGEQAFRSCPENLRAGARAGNPAAIQACQDWVQAHGGVN